MDNRILGKIETFAGPAAGVGMNAAGVGVPCGAADEEGPSRYQSDAERKRKEKARKAKKAANAARKRNRRH